MNKHLDEYLIKKYPKIFADRYKPMNQTCMCWGFSCGNGWLHLIDRLCASIQHHIDNPVYVEPTGFIFRLKKLWNTVVWNNIIYPLIKRLPHEDYRQIENNFYFHWDYVPAPKIHQVVANQVKEKFGGLRFYCSGGDESTRAMVDFAESLSYHICEECGRFDETVVTSGKSWIRSTCPCCTKTEDKAVHKKALNQESTKLWETVREEEAKKTPTSEMKEAFKQVEEVKNYGKKKS